MAVTIEIRIVGLERVVGKLQPSLYMPAIGRLLGKAALLGQREARDAAPYDTGALKRSILTEVKPMSASVYSTLGYAAVMDLGRRRGAPPPPTSALLGWMRRHGFRGSPFVLARSISRRGIKGRFFFQKARNAVIQALPGFVAQAGREIAEQWGR